MAKNKVTIQTTRSLKARFWENWELYLFCLPGILLVIIYHYIPIYGIQIAFKDFSVRKGFWGSPWVGMRHFIRFFESPNAWLVIRNTLVLNVYSLIAGTPIPIILALMLNSFIHKKYTKAIQAITYAPNFISTIVMCGMIILFLSPRGGMVNQFLGFFGVNPINFMAERSMWRHIYVWTGVWQGMGYSAVIYFAALAGVNPELHEAAIVDGATKVQRMWHIDLPTIMPTIVMLLILSMGSMMGSNFDKVYALQNPLNLNVSENIATYTYKVGMLNSDMSYSTAIGLWNSAVNAILLVTVNAISRKVSDNALW
jgi:putative aldouronate transport system permease protein